MHWVHHWRVFVINELSSLLCDVEDDLKRIIGLEMISSL